MIALILIITIALMFAFKMLYATSSKSGARKLPPNFHAVDWLHIADLEKDIYGEVLSEQAIKAKSDDDWLHLRTPIVVPERKNVDKLAAQEWAEALPDWQDEEGRPW